MKTRCFILLILVVPLSTDLLGQIYVSTTGNDSNSGTVDLPLATPQAAMAKITSDGTGAMIYLRGGVYHLSTQVKNKQEWSFR